MIHSRPWEEFGTLIVCRCIGSIIVCASQNIGMLIAGRIINGFSVGICSAQVPVYISELAPPTKRGRLVGAQQWAITWGIMIMVCLRSYHISEISTDNASFTSPTAVLKSTAPPPSASRGLSK
jgi:MFS family permease